MRSCQCRSSQMEQQPDGAAARQEVRVQRCSREGHGQGGAGVERELAQGVNQGLQGQQAGWHTGKARWGREGNEPVWAIPWRRAR